MSPVRRRLGRDLLQQDAGPVAVAGFEVALGRLDGAVARLPPGAGRGQPASLLPELGRRVGCAAGHGPAGGLVQGGGDPSVGALGGEGEMPATLLGIVQDRGQPGMQRPLPGRRELGVGDRPSSG